MSALRRTSLKQGPPGPPGAVSSGPVAWTPGSISSGAFASRSVTMSGAVVGLPAWAAFDQILPDGMWFWCQVTSPTAAKVYLFNSSGSPQTIAAGNVTVEALTQ